MNWKCLLGHQWQIKSLYQVREMTPGYSEPTNYYTDFLYFCPKCKNVKTKRLDGLWYKKKDDDDKDTPKEPVLSPDDYYESIGKK